MCTCFKPAFDDYEFGYALGIAAPSFEEDGGIGYAFFPNRDKRSTLLADAKQLLKVLKQEMTRASAGELESIPGLFQIHWSPIQKFQEGYLAGLKVLKASLEHLNLELQRMNDLGETDATFYEVVLPWANNWQSKNQKFNFLEIEPFAQDSGGTSIRILSETRSALIDDDWLATLRWLECESFSAYPVEEIVSEVWSQSLKAKLDGVAFSSKFGRTGPDYRDLTFWDFELPNICEDHWQNVVSFNDEQMRNHNIVR